MEKSQPGGKAADKKTQASLSGNDTRAAPANAGKKKKMAEFTARKETTTKRGISKKEQETEA